MKETDTHRPVLKESAGWAAIYLALALLAAMPYFLLVVDYPSATTVAAKVALVAEHYASMYAMYLATYVAFGAAVGILALALHDRLATLAPRAARVATGVGLLWSIMLIGSGMIFTYGMTTTVALAANDPEQARLAWQAIEPVALALGGAGGELLGGVWVLLVSLLALRQGALSKPLGWLGITIGAVGVVSVVPPIHDAAIVFGLLEIVWFAWLGVSLLMPRAAVGVQRVDRESKIALAR